MRPDPEARICRWCGGNGLDPFLPTRIRQFLTHSPYYLVEVVRPAHVPLASYHVEQQRLLADVNEWNPLNEFLEDVSTEMRGCRDISATPFDLVGRTYHGLRCPRCRGTGRQTRLAAVEFHMPWVA